MSGEWVSPTQAGAGSTCAGLESTTGGTWESLEDLDSSTISK